MGHEKAGRTGRRPRCGRRPCAGPRGVERRTRPTDAGGRPGGGARGWGCWRAPGAGWSYSNTGYIVLGLIVEAATGDSIGAELSKRIFAPLALRRTSFSTGQRISGAHAHGYYRLPKRSLQDVTAISPSFAWTAGAIVSTV